ncbi:acyltransferase family protein [Krasilnikovia sp. MM14-A1004]|uniref:acyltransferase family protein n=1 Tax=Krasilnikovia sp. MM14-A1004 TaxID=3373541 RepID=UPI00399D3798
MIRAAVRRRPAVQPAAVADPLGIESGRSGAQRASERMAWLDGLRAVAVLLVVYAHLSRYLLRDVRALSGEWVHAGTAGVMLFFLVSGYIIPASLERHADVRKFWVSRICRLVPLYLAVTGVVVVLGAGGLVPLDPYLTAHPATAGLAHLSMLPYLLGVPLVTPVFWTLSFEMAFYLLVTALFAVRLHRAGGVLAVVLAGCAVLTAPLAPALLSGSPARGPAVVVIVAVVLVCGLLAVTSGRRWAVPTGGLALGGLAVVLVAANQGPAHVWDGLLIVAVMFVGTTIYRADRGQTGWWPVVLVGGVVAVALVANWFAELESLGAPTPQYKARSVLTLVVFAGAFAVGMVTRRWRTPRPLARLGVLSYSVYLNHFVLIQLLQPVLADLGERLPAPAQFAAVAAYLAVLAGVSTLTYRWVELPWQRLGRRWAAAAPRRSQASPVRESTVAEHDEFAPSNP